MRRPAPGFAYLALLFAVAFLGAGLGVAGEVWRIQAQREREQQLLWTGHQYRRAIEAYWRATGGNAVAGGAAAAAGTASATGASGTSAGATAAGVAATGAPGTPGASRYPPSLDNLLVDPRFQQIRRYLRKRYPDPITGQDDWVPILSPSGGVMGVHSASEAAPIKVAGFGPTDVAFTDKTHYSEWAFVFVPSQAQRRPGAGADPGAGAKSTPLGARIDR